MQDLLIGLTMNESLKRQGSFLRTCRTLWKNKLYVSLCFIRGGGWTEFSLDIPFYFLTGNQFVLNRFVWLFLWNIICVVVSLVYVL